MDRETPSRTLRLLRADVAALEDGLRFHEKAMKGFLGWHDRPFRKTHNLVEIGQACVEIDYSLERLLRDAAPLTEYAWRFRYPSDPDEPSVDEARNALDTARQVVEALLKRLPDEVAADD